MNNLQPENLQLLYIELKQLEKQQEEYKQQITNLQTSLEVLVKQKEETEKKYDETILKYRQQKCLIQQKEKQYGLHDHLDTPIDIALKIRRLSIITSVSIWLFWTGIGFVIWLAYQILLFQQLLNLLKNGVNHRRTTYITLDMLSFLFFPAFIVSPILASWIKRRIRLYRNNHPEEK